MLFFGKVTSISSRLKLLNVFVGGVALLLAFASFLAYDMVTFERDLVRTLHTEGQIIGANTVSALLFQDEQAAAQTLSALRASPEVISAIVVGADAKPFATYNRDPSSPLPQLRPLPSGNNDTHWKHGKLVLYASRIMFKGESVGTLYMLAQPEAAGQRVAEYGLIAALVLLLCMIIALLLTSRFQGQFTRPLIGLAQTAQIVRREKDYSVRAKTSPQDDELALLVRSFNEMLDDIQERDHALAQSRTALEERVQQRTAELRAANKELEAFSYTVAHDLRGPLDSVSNIGFLLKQIYSDRLDAEGRHFVDDLLLSTRKMSTLIRDLLNLSRSSSQTFHREMVDLSAMAASVIDNLKTDDSSRDVEAAIAPGIRVLADDGLLCVAMENLIGNAWKYSSKRPHAHIEFGTIELKGETVFFVKDDGAGFNPAYADRLFQPFQRLHLQSDFPGTGVGLATVRRIVTRHGGAIWAESTLGQGATFYFTLPYTGHDLAETGI
jgi:signal transduction histidine kinase